MIDSPELLSFLQEEETRARDTTIDEQRAALLNFYNGEPYGDEEDGRSQLVTRDVAECVDHMTVSVLRTMVSGDKVVEFEDSEDDAPEAGEQQGQPEKPVNLARQATEAIHWYFMRKGRGYSVLHDTLKAGLLEKTGWVKVYPERPQPKRIQQQVPAEFLNMVDAVEAEPVDESQPEGMYRVTIEQQQPVCFRALAVPNEEMLIAPDARDLDEPPYIAHRTPETVSSLRKMGFETDGLSDNGNDWQSENLSDTRDTDRSWYGREVDRGGVMRRMWLLEEYVRFDANGDGIAELLCVHRVGTTILRVQEVEGHPFEYWCPFPMQHRLIGQSLADKVADIQRTNSVLLRNAMDSLYVGLAPRVLLHETSIGPDTVEDLLTVRPNGVIRWKGSQEPRPLANNDTSPAAFGAIEFMIGQRESRTGITRLNQGLDADTLNKTATGTALMQAQGQQIEEYVARNFAEMLVGRMFVKFYHLMRKYGEPFRMKIDGQMVDVDPRAWPEEMNITVRVGLGSGRKEQRLVYRQQLLGVQQAIMQAGMPMVTPENIFNSVKGLIEDANLGNPLDYIEDPSTMEQQPERPDPAMAEVQGKMQMEAQKQQFAQQSSEAEQALQSEKASLDLELKRAQAEQAAMLAERKAQFEADLAERKFVAEIALSRERLVAEMELARERQGHEMAVKSASITENRDGGSLAA